MSATSAEIVSVNPASPDDVVTTVMPAGGIEVDRAVERAAAAARGYARTPAAARGAGLAAVADALEARSQELAALVVREVGKPIIEARGEVARTVAILRYHAQVALDPDGDTYPVGRRPLAALLAAAAARRRGADHALELPGRDPGLEARAGAGLRQRRACGSRRRTRPRAPRRCSSCLATELPDGAVADRAGARRRRRGARRRIRASRRCRSRDRSTIGRGVARMAAERGAAAQCEMGGQNASIVLADADVEAAAAMIAGAAMGYAGQKCTATSRVICDAPGAVRRMRDALAAAVAADARSRIRPTTACQVGPLISAEAARRRARAAVARGGGGGRPADHRRRALDAPGNYLAADPVEVADPAAEVAQEEVFAPVCALMRRARRRRRRRARERRPPRPRRPPSSRATSTACIDLAGRPRHRPRADQPAHVGRRLCTRRSAARRPPASARASRARPRASSTPACARC